MLVSLSRHRHPSTYSERRLPRKLVILQLLRAPSLVKPGLALFMVGPSQDPLVRCAEPAGTLHSHILILQSILPSISSIFSIHHDCICAVLSLSSLHLSSSTSTSYLILTTIPPSVYHPPNVCAGNDPTPYSMLHLLPEWYIICYGWFAALLQYVVARLLGDVTPYTQHAEGAVHINGLKTDMKHRGTTSTSLNLMLEGKDISTLLAKLEERNPVYYRLYQLSVEPRTGERTRNQVSRRPRGWAEEDHIYVMVIYRALRCLCGPETFPYTPSPPTPSRGDVGRKQTPCFDLPKPLRRVLHTDLVQNVEHLHARLAAPAPLEQILNAVRLYISSLSYLLDAHAWGGEEGVLTPRRRFDGNSKLQQQEFRGILSTRLGKVL
jgi:hypothetical protein